VNFLISDAVPLLVNVIVMVGNLAGFDVDGRFF